MQVVPNINDKTIQEFESSVSQKGQVTLPLQVREKLAIKAKDKVVFRVEGNEIRIVPVRMSLDDVYMSVPALKTPKTLAEMREVIHDELAERFAKE